MPIFEYRCSHCSQNIERIQRKPLPDLPCPSCGRAAVRSVSRVSVRASAGTSTCSVPDGSGFT